MKRSGGTRYMYLSALITVAAALTACTQKPAWNNIPGIMFMLQMMGLILTSTPRKQTPHG